MARIIEQAHGVSMEQQGLKRPKLKGAKSETEREIERRVRRYSQDPEQLSAGKVTKLISNITFDQLNGDIRLNEKKVAGCIYPESLTDIIFLFLCHCTVHFILEL